MEFNKIVLLVEDNPDDASLLELTKDLTTDLILRRVESGGEAVEYLEGRGLYSMRDSFPLPTMILLHLKLPYVKGSRPKVVYTARVPSGRFSRISTVGKRSPL